MIKQKFMGININCKHQDFIQQIIDGLKTVETRNTPSLRPYIGKQVGLVRTGKGKAEIIAFAEITEEIYYSSVEEFRADYNSHRVAPGSKFDIKTVKYGYKLENVEALDEPIKCSRKGIVARDITDDFYNNVYWLSFK